MRTTTAVLCAALTLAVVSAATAATGLKGTWVAKTASGKMTLTLAGAGSSYRGTLTTVAGGKKSVVEVTGRFDNADGAKQLSLTFPKTRSTTMCGLVGPKLYCQIATGTAIFTRG